MSTMKTALRRVAVGAGALALAMAGAVASGTAAWAAPGNIDPDAEGTLTVHKYGGGASTAEHDGSELETDPNRPPLYGVEFTVCEVTAIEGEAVDLTTVEGWAVLEDYMAANPVPDKADLTFGDCQDDTTDVDGVVPFTLPVGLYFVEETDPGDNPITSTSIEFLVTIPFPTGSSGDWNYNPHVYPKNTLDSEPTKTVDDADAVVEGDVVEWTVTSPVLGIAPESTIDEFVLTDELVSQLEYVTGSLTATLVNGTVETPLVFDVNYAPAGPGGTITAEASGPALVSLNAAASSAYVVFTFETTVVGAGLLQNTAVVNVGGTSKTTVPAETPWGLAELTKTDEENGALLDGAEFDVYVAGTDGVCPPDPEGTPVVSGLVTGSGTNDPGVLTTPALKAGDYCFREVTAPVGYVLPEGDAAWVAFTVEAGEEVSASVEMDNVKMDGPNLPLTGAGGTLAMTIGGLLLVGGGTGAIILSRRRRHGAL